MIMITPAKTAKPRARPVEWDDGATCWYRAPVWSVIATGSVIVDPPHAVCCQGNYPRKGSIRPHPKRVKLPRDADSTSRSGGGTLGPPHLCGRYLASDSVWLRRRSGGPITHFERETSCPNPPHQTRQYSICWAKSLPTQSRRRASMRRRLRLFDLPLWSRVMRLTSPTP